MGKNKGKPEEERVTLTKEAKAHSIKNKIRRKIEVDKVRKEKKKVRKIGIKMNFYCHFQIM